jgi:TPR repeat protein
MKTIKLVIYILFLFFAFPVLSIAEPIDDAAAAIDAKEWEKAYELLTPLAQENNLLAKALLGAMYIRGQGVDIDANKGLALIMDAASQGNEMARGLAAVYNKELAESGDIKAMYNTGYMCLNGWTGEIDPNQCIRWLEVAAQNGHELSAKMLSRIYAKGMFGIAKDEEKAAGWGETVNN